MTTHRHTTQTDMPMLLLDTPRPPIHRPPHARTSFVVPDTLTAALLPPSYLPWRYLHRGRTRRIRTPAHQIRPPPVWIWIVANRCRPQAYRLHRAGRSSVTTARRTERRGTTQCAPTRRPLQVERRSAAREGTRSDKTRGTEKVGMGFALSPPSLQPHGNPAACSGDGKTGEG